MSFIPVPSNGMGHAVIWSQGHLLAVPHHLHVRD